VRTWLRRSLWDLVPRDQRDTTAALRRRQVVAAVTVLVGAALLGVSLRIEPGSVWFYPATFALAGVWLVGALASGRLHLGRILVRDELRFLASAVVLGPVPFVADQVTDVLDHAAEGSLALVAVVTIVNGIAEELFFRGTVYAAVPRRPVLVSTAAYTLTTVAAGNLLLVVAALLLGLVVGLERRASGGILGPAITHVTWALAMLFGLPLVFS
jgi:membrane protease YdiL (CAAX protease family)